jgi:gliding motility-associated-like protein
MPTFGYAELQINGTVTYTSNEDYCGLDAFAYEICNEIGCDTATVNLMIKCPKPIPMTGFSPNHDGVNDGFYVAGIDQYPNNEVIIFNRWGEKVYEKKNYINGEWQGTFENRDLPDGTYFYLIKYGTNGKMSGYVQIER